MSKNELVEAAMGIVQVLQKPTEKRHLHKVFLKGPKLNKKKKSGIHSQLFKYKCTELLDHVLTLIKALHLKMFDSSQVS